MGRAPVCAECAGVRSRKDLPVRGIRGSSVRSARLVPASASKISHYPTVYLL